MAIFSHREPIQFFKTKEDYFKNFKLLKRIYFSPGDIKFSWSLVFLWRINDIVCLCPVLISRYPRFSTTEDQPTTTAKQLSFVNELLIFRRVFWKILSLSLFKVELNSIITSCLWLPSSSIRLDTSWRLSCRPRSMASQLSRQPQVSPLTLTC